METTVYVNFEKIKACLDTSSYRIIDDLVRDSFLSSSKNRLMMVRSVKLSAAMFVRKMSQIVFHIFQITDWLLLWLRKESYS